MRKRPPIDQQKSARALEGSTAAFAARSRGAGTATSPRAAPVSVGRRRGRGAPRSRYFKGTRQGPQSSTLPQPSEAKPQLAPRLSHVSGVHFGGGSTPMQAPKSNSIYSRTFSCFVRSPL